jgi:hypothetical protein
LQALYQQGAYCISYESFIGPLQSGGALVDVIPHRLKKIFGDRAVKILMTIRRQDEFLKSLYAQWVASGGTTRVHQFLDQKVLDRPHIDLRTFDYLATFHSYAEVFGAENILVLPYELMKQEEGRFLELLNAFSGENFQTVERSQTAVNRSLSGYQIAWMRFLNKIFETQMSMDYLLPRRFFDTTRYRQKLQRSNFLRFGSTFNEQEEQFLQDTFNSYAAANAELNQRYPQYDLQAYGYY